MGNGVLERIFLSILETRYELFNNAEDVATSYISVWFASQELTFEALLLRLVTKIGVLGQTLFNKLFLAVEDAITWNPFKFHHSRTFRYFIFGSSGDSSNIS